MADVTPVFERQSAPRGQFWKMTRLCCIWAGSIDAAFFVLFLLLGSPILAWINIISIAMYATAIWALKARRNRLAVALIWIEVTVHAALGSLLIGWDSGFHYFLLMFIPALFAGMRTTRHAWYGVLGLWAFYVALDLLMRFVEPLQPISPAALLWVHLFNLSVVFLMFSYLSVFYVGTVTRADRHLRRMAATDALTGLYNRRYVINLLERPQAEDAEFETTALLLLDVDHFKTINDQHGHEAGDLVLQAVSRAIKACVREQDTVARWGGEEFLAVLPGSDLESARTIAERVRQAVEQAGTGLACPLSVSIGISMHQAGEPLNNSIARADEALYRGKSAGRNRVELATN